MRLYLTAYQKENDTNRDFICTETTTTAATAAAADAAAAATTTTILLYYYNLQLNAPHETERKH